MHTRIRQFDVVKRGQGKLQGRGIATLITVAMLAACTNTTEPVGAIKIVPISGTVSLQTSPQGPTLSTSLTLTNWSAHTIYWHPCALSLERKIGDVVALDQDGEPGWQRVWSPVCGLDLVAASAVEPGESVTVPISVVATRDYSPSFTGDPGLYRVHLYISTKIGADYQAVPYRASSSEPFEVIAQ
jgi:hypothetical protein